MAQSLHGTWIHYMTESIIRLFSDDPLTFSSYISYFKEVRDVESQCCILWQLTHFNLERFGEICEEMDCVWAAIWDESLIGVDSRKVLVRWMKGGTLHPSARMTHNRSRRPKPQQSLRVQYPSSQEWMVVSGLYKPGASVLLSQWCIICYMTFYKKKKAKKN